ncbi:hypothetical protein [Salinisphaera sp. T31B1]|uniref:hypothetical protein n=1 Tax=Salinisphaera sp. T31B1 TaxID=727963 RepID=UPI00333F6981
MTDFTRGSKTRQTVPPPRWPIQCLIVGVLALALSGCDSNDNAESPASDAEQPSATTADGMATEATIRARIIGNTVAGTMSPDSRYTEYYAPDGTIHGAGYTADWRIEGDRMCFDYDEAPTADCYSVRIQADAVEWHRGNEIQGKGTIVEGNPHDF